jgi:hypothetical protein
MAAIETAIRALAAAKAARRAFEAQHGGREGYVLVLDAPLYQQYRRIVATYHEASSALWRVVNQAVEEVTE